ncbi:MAG: hypothetical protein ACLQVJ_13555 [Syntrophobacteraceae bacterium]
MKSTEQTTSSPSNSLESSQETQLTLEDALELLGLKEAPFGPDNYGILIGGTQRLIKRYGREWVIKHRDGLVEELKVVADLL